MITITKEYRTETGHRLHPYDGKCAHLHGHSYLWQVTVQSDEALNEQGMVTDFGNLKAAMIEVLEPLDHCMVLSQNDPLVLAHSTMDLVALLKASNGHAPRLKIMRFNPTAENFSRWAADHIEDLLPQGIHVVKVVVWETETSHAEWVAS